MSTGATYPVRVDATLDRSLSRWLWLFKWLLVIPHYVVLMFLWIAFVVASMIAFFAIVFTGRYPLSLFEFNVGVLRWSWRVAYYSYGTLGTDRYPPFTLAEVADYPAHLEIAYPERLSRGLALVKWWLLAIPQYAVVSVFVGGGAWAGFEADRNTAWWGPGGLIGLLVLIAAVALAFTGSYPRQLFDFVLGLNRWVLRVAAYAALMTDRYPPFRLDIGGHESSFAPLGVHDTAPSAAPASPSSLGSSMPPSARSGWTVVRVLSLVVGSLMALMSLGLLAAGGAATWLHNTQRDAAGYLTSDVRVFSTPGYAITSDRIDLGTSEVVAPSALLGTVRFRVTAANPARPIFVGIAPQALVDRYLAGVGRATVTNWASGPANLRLDGGGPPSEPPSSAAIWVSSTSGRGTQILTWRPTGGDWRVVVMNEDGGGGVSVAADAGATVPALGWIAAGFFAFGGLLLAGGTALIVSSVVRASRQVAMPRAEQGGGT